MRGSDGLSGITANPVVGAFSDLLVRHGGTTILTEVPGDVRAENLSWIAALHPELFERNSGS